MAHYAFLDDKNRVTHVIAGRDENDLIDGVSSWEEYYSQRFNQKCVRTSYNNNIRKNFAGIGFIYDENLDAFYTPQPFPSWILNEESCVWEPPIPKPEDHADFVGHDLGKEYFWDEESQSWTIVNP